MILTVLPSKAQVPSRWMISAMGKFSQPGQHGVRCFTRADRTCPTRALFRATQCPVIARQLQALRGSSRRGEGGSGRGGAGGETRLGARWRARCGTGGGAHGRLHLRGLSARGARGAPARRCRVPRQARRAGVGTGTARRRRALGVRVPAVGLRRTHPVRRPGRRARTRRRRGMAGTPVATHGVRGVGGRPDPARRPGPHGDRRGLDGGAHGGPAGRSGGGRRADGRGLSAPGAGRGPRPGRRRGQPPVHLTGDGRRLGPVRRLRRTRSRGPTGGGLRPRQARRPDRHSRTRPRCRW